MRPGATPSRARSCTSCAAGELARTGHIPHTPYYGTVDATPLFLMVAGGYYRWTLDLETMVRLRPALDARAPTGSMSWAIATATGSSSTSSARRPACVNHGWKDSHDSIVHADGSLAEGPIALVEVQGYVYEAKLRIADVYEALGTAAGRQLAERGQRAAGGVQRGVLGSRRGVLRARARRSQGPGPQRHVQPGALPVLRDRRRRQGRCWSQSG